MIRSTIREVSPSFPDTRCQPAGMPGTPVRSGADASSLNVSLIVTEHCNLGCPDCVHRIPFLKQRRHMPVSYFEWLSGVFAGVRIRSLIIEGGEPTLHPDFGLLARNWREWFDIGSLVLTTNGCQLQQIEDSLGRFDEVQLTEYPGLNDREIAWARERGIPGLHVGFDVPGGEQFPLDAKPFAGVENPPMCRWRNCRIVWARKIWICVGAENAGRHVPLDRDGWIKKLDRIDRPGLCRDCFVPASWRLADAKSG